MKKLIEGEKERVRKIETPRLNTNANYQIPLSTQPSLMTVKKLEKLFQGCEKRAKLVF